MTIAAVHKEHVRQIKLDGNYFHIKKSKYVNNTNGKTRRPLGFADLQNIVTVIIISEAVKVAVLRHFKKVFPPHTIMVNNKPVKM